MRSALTLAVLLLAGAATAEQGGSIEQRPTLRKGRVELMPAFAVSVNDPFFVRTGGALRAAVHVSEAFAVALRGAYFAPIPTDDLRIAKRQFGTVTTPLPTWLAMADLEWAPLYGKVAAGDSILHFDVYATAGLGAAVGRPAFDLGGGARCIFRDAVAFTVALVDTAYLEPAGLQNVLMLYAGLSVLLPFRP